MARQRESTSMVHYLMNKVKSLSLPEQMIKIFVSDVLRIGHSTHTMVG